MRPKIVVRRGHGACRTGKTRFRDEKSARLAVNWSQEQADREVLPTRWYRCPFCHDWHVTSQEAISDS